MFTELNYDTIYLYICICMVVLQHRTWPLLNPQPGSISNPSGTFICRFRYAISSHELNTGRGLKRYLEIGNENLYSDLFLETVAACQGRG